ncbi:response regulator [Spirosoma sp. KCTC 42546]|uniref:response regulator n=1 Tax=Spirosoma sp. KCTC 42546 TaxID=2520506 RepID=UPI00115ACCF8|nr:response regulator [Spirosoma sp. KCTC 42546]QDK80181.1 response regulator [Spirosoma sp. KCTC 42546]
MPTHILLIEDEEQIRKNLLEILQLKGYQVTAGADGLAGIQLASQQPPDLILCDIMMPQLSGYQVLAHIRTQESLSSVPFIFLTAKSDMVDFRQGMELGADDYLTKPFSTKDLLAAIESRLKRHQLRPTPQASPVWLQTIQGHAEGGRMILRVADCLYFYVHTSAYYVCHPLGTFQIDLTMAELAAQLDATQFFRANRQVILHRKSIQKYAYWQQGKYCLFLVNGAKAKEIIIPKARFRHLKKWLAG